MKLRFLPVAAVSTFLILFALPVRADEPVFVRGVSPLTRVMKGAVAPLREQGVDLKVGAECGTTQALAELAAGEIDLALLGRPLTAEERAFYPDKRFEEFQLGAQAVALLVARPVWDSGIHALKRAQVEALYENRVSSWQQFGGEDRPPKFFEPAHGPGVWEIFAGWLYGDQKKAPAVPWEIVADGQEAQLAVQFHSGGITVATAGWADRRNAFALGIIDDSGAVLEPTREQVAAGKYPLARAVFIVSGKKETGDRRKVIEFMLSEAGQAIVAANDLFSIDSLRKP